MIKVAVKFRLSFSEGRQAIVSLFIEAALTSVELLLRNIFLNLERVIIVFEILLFVNGI